MLAIGHLDLAVRRRAAPARAVTGRRGPTVRILRVARLKGVGSVV